MVCVPCQYEVVAGVDNTKIRWRSNSYTIQSTSIQAFFINVTITFDRIFGKVCFYFNEETR